MNIPQNLMEALRVIVLAGGSPKFVGGTVRDHLWGNEPKDFDVEVSNLSWVALKDVLSNFGTVDVVGKQFAVLKLHHMNADFSLPRLENKVGVGHKDFEVIPVENLSLEDRCRRRDLTMNAIEMDPFTLKIEDPFNGQADMKANVLRATDPKKFVEDDLRSIRVAQFISRFPQMVPNDELIQLCSQADLSHLPGERIWEEFRKMLLKGSRPDLGLDHLEKCGLLKFFPELKATVGCMQHPVFHAEGDVFTHTKMVLRVASTLRNGVEEDDLVLMFAALCHDFGKPPTTVWSHEKGRLVSNGHDEAGVKPAREFLKRLNAPQFLQKAVKVLVKEHLRPFMLVKENAGPKAYRTLARRMEGVSLNLLANLAIADSEGRICYDPVHQTRADIDTFLQRAAAGGVDLVAPPEDVVKGRHLLEKGMMPGIQIGQILAECRAYQDETGEKDPEKILAVVLHRAVGQ